MARHSTRNVRPEMKKGRLEADLFKKQMVPRRGLGHTSATPAALASAAFRVLAQSAQALCFLGLKKKKGRQKPTFFK
ncbi:hypothetical protein [Burkholderia sp. BCC1998]|uniref:hypothetical protein n=1 Tax=Burkholderia sp. BCC1998 TaxID=2817447 RepID=UPI002AB7BEEC|nr:hypothetical protein [Burkholderia sp. BCC1998]